MKNFTIASQQETTIDYPGKMALIVFAPGCNFRCGFCHNPELVLENAGAIDINVLLKNIENRKNAGWYQGVCISGGEPTLNHGLVDFCRKLKEIGLSVKLDTNGSNPLILKELFEKSLVDYIAMDIKATKEKYSEVANAEIDIEDIEKSIKIAKSFPVYEFRTTVLPFFTISDFEEIGKWLSSNGEEKVKIFSLQQFNPKNTLDASFMKMTPKNKEEIEKIAEIMKKYAEYVRVLA
jgi:pyruvate formate lyase activating enzyme